MPAPLRISFCFAAAACSLCAELITVINGLAQRRACTDLRQIVKERSWRLVASGLVGRGAAPLAGEAPAAGLCQRTSIVPYLLDFVNHLCVVVAGMGWLWVGLSP